MCMLNGTSRAPQRYVVRCVAHVQQISDFLAHQLRRERNYIRFAILYIARGTSYDATLSHCLTLRGYWQWNDNVTRRHRGRYPALDHTLALSHARGP